jgi:anti-sigma regulatory factor (Ser/Thr protein kinase)
MQINRVYPNTPSSVTRARRAVGKFAVRAGFGSQDVSDIVLAVGEACNNAAEHGIAPHGRFVISCVFDGSTLAVDVTDNGRGFDVPSSRWQHAFEHEMPRGRGMAIMRALMDDVLYKSGAGGTTVRLRKQPTLAGGNNDGTKQPAQRVG